MCEIPHTCDIYVTRRDQSQVEFFLGLKIFAPLRGAVHRGTRSDPEKVNLAFVRTHKTKRGPTTFGFIT